MPCAAVPTVPAGSSFPCMHAWPCLCSDAAADSVLTLLFAGHDTSATSLTRILWHLQAHPEAEARLRAEQVGHYTKRRCFCCTGPLWLGLLTLGACRHTLRGRGGPAGGASGPGLRHAGAHCQPSLPLPTPAPPAAPRCAAPRCAVQAEVLAKHGPQLTDAALEDMRYTDAVVRLH